MAFGFCLHSVCINWYKFPYFLSVVVIGLVALLKRGVIQGFNAKAIVFLCPV